MILGGGLECILLSNIAPKNCCLKIKYSQEASKCCQLTNLCKKIDNIC